MHTLESRKLQLQARGLIEHLTPIVELNERLAQNENTPSMESAEAIELLSNTYLQPLEYGLEVDTELEPQARIQANLEALKDVVDRLRTLSEDADKDGKNIKEIADKAEELDKTFLNSKWLDDQELSYDRVELGKFGAAFMRKGKLVEGILSDVKDEIPVLKRLVNQVTSDVASYAKAVADNADKEDKKLPSTPADNYSEKDHSFLGATAKEDLCVKNDDGEWVYNLEWALDFSDVKDAPKDIPSLGHDPAAEFAKYAKDLCELYQKVIRFATDDKNDVITGEDTRHSTDGLLLLQTHLENLINAIHAYLFASVDDKANKKEEGEKKDKEESKDEKKEPSKEDNASTEDNVAVEEKKEKSSCEEKDDGKEKEDKKEGEDDSKEEKEKDADKDSDKKEEKEEKEEDSKKDKEEAKEEDKDDKKDSE